MAGTIPKVRIIAINKKKRTKIFSIKYNFGCGVAIFKENNTRTCGFCQTLIFSRLSALALFIVHPHPQEFHLPRFIVHLVHKTVLDIDAA